MYPVLLIYYLLYGLYEIVWLARMPNNDLIQQLHTVTKQRDDLLKKLVELRTAISYAKEIEIIELSMHLYKNVQLVTIAQVMVRHCTEHEHFFLINAGSAQGVKPDMVVVCNRMLIGRIVAVYPWYSKVLLVSDKQSKIAAFIGQESVSAIYQGENSQHEGELVFVSNPDELVDQELVLSSGQGMIYPYGFAIGTAKKKKDGRVKTSFFSDMKHIRYCCVVTKNSELLNT